GGIPVAGPLPDIADHIEKAVASWRKGSHRRGAPVGADPPLRELAMPGVSHRLAAGHELAAPGKFRAFEPASRRELPLRFGWEILARPARIGLCVLIGYVHGRVAIKAAN